jgi:antitoxin CptB
MDVQTRIRQLCWRSKRGLLELELLLLPFADACLGELSRDELAQYGRLLECEDLDLYDWLRGRNVADEDLRDDVLQNDFLQDQDSKASLQPIIDRIRHFHNR